MNTIAYMIKLDRQRPDADAAASHCEGNVFADGAGSGGSDAARTGIIISK